MGVDRSEVVLADDEPTCFWKKKRKKKKRMNSHCVHCLVRIGIKRSSVLL